MKGRFDNDADALQASPAFVTQYIDAAREIAQEAVGDPKAPPNATTYGDPGRMVISLPPRGAPGTGRQQEYIPACLSAPAAASVVEHNFPADGDYELTIGDMALAREVPRMEFENTVDRAARRQGVLPHEYRRRGRSQGHRPDSWIRRSRDQQPAAQDPLSRDRGPAQLAVTFLHRSFAESDERIRTVASRAGRNASRPRTRCRSAGRSRSRA